MTSDPRLANHRILFFRSFYPNHVPVGVAKDDRLKGAFDLMARAGLDTQNIINLRPTNKRLSDPLALEPLGFIRQLEGLPCALFVWSKQEDELETLGFFERLMLAYPDPISGSPLIWLREEPGKAFLRLTGPDNSPLFALSLPYRATYSDAEAQVLQRFLTIKRTSSTTIETLEQPEDEEDPITVLPPPPDVTPADATVRVPAMKDASFIHQLNANFKKKRPNT